MEKSRGKCKCFWKEEEKYYCKYFDIKMPTDEANRRAELNILMDEPPWRWLNQLWRPSEGDGLT